MNQPDLPIPLPEDLFWLDAEVRALQRKAAYAKTQKGVLKPGATRRGGIDLPADADWARGRSPEDFYVHHEDGQSVCLQLNLEEIPAEVRRPEWPAMGVLWVFLEDGPRHGYEVTVQFDPRPAASIPWRCLAEPKAAVTSWVIESQLPWATEKTLPVLAHWSAMGAIYDKWVQDRYLARHLRGVVVGGYAFTNQGDLDEDSAEFVLAIEDMEFGDSGEVYVFFNPARGFYGRADVC